MEIPSELVDDEWDVITIFWLFGHCMGRRKRRRIVLATVLLVLAVAIGMARSREESETVKAHVELDKILYPRFYAAVNDWALRHPGQPDHERNLDAGDMKRWQAVRDAWHDLDAAARRMGY
jgi:hypothetical protein